MHKTPFITALVIVLALSLPVASAQTTAPQAVDIPTTLCGADGCKRGNELLLQVQEEPMAAPSPAPAAPVGANVPAPGGQFVTELPDGAVVWATEDPALSAPVLNVQTGSMAPFENGRLTKPLRFHGYNNYASFIERIEITLYRGSDTDLVTPLARIDMPVDYVANTEWDGQLPADLNLREGDDLQYIARAYGKDGSFDETSAQRFQLVLPTDYERGTQQVRDNVQKTLGRVLNGEDARDQQLTNAIYGQNALRQQNIPIYGSRVRIYGRGLAPNARVLING